MQYATINLTTTWVGWLNLAIFIVAYYFIAKTEKYDINKAIPAFFAGTSMFMSIGIYYSLNGLDPTALDLKLETLILYIAKVFFFLLVTMTYIEIMFERGIFNFINYHLLAHDYTYKKLFWLLGLLSFFLSSVVNSLATALIVATILMSIDKKNSSFLLLGAINIVVATNAGAVWSSFGDITTLMLWIQNKALFTDFLFLFPASLAGWAITAYLLSFSLPKGRPEFFPSKDTKPVLQDGAFIVVLLALGTIIISIVGKHFFDFPAMWGMMFGLAILKIFSIYLQKKGKNKFCVYLNMKNIEHDTLLFIFGILSSIAALHFLGFLDYIHDFYNTIGASQANISIGFLSALIDNVTVMNTLLQTSPTMSLKEWMLANMTIGIGGSLLSFGSVAGIVLMSKLPGIYTFGSHIKYAWSILAGYIVSIAVWYVQFEIIKLY